MDATLTTPDMPPPREPRAWKFWGTLAWGLLIFVAMGIGQIAMVAYFVWSRGGSYASRRRAISWRLGSGSG